jgi:molybdate transport system permease protein
VRSVRRGAARPVRLHAARGEATVTGCFATGLPTAAEWQVITLSLRVALVAVAVTLPIGVLLGWLLARREFRGKVLISTALNIPLVLPPVVTGYLLLLLCGPSGPVGRAFAAVFGADLAFSWLAASLAAGVVAFPLLLRTIQVAVDQVDPRLEAAARTLGAGRVRVFLTVTLPLSARGILAGSVLAFGRSLGEFGATIMVAGNIPGRTQTLPLAIFSLTHRVGEEAGIVRLLVFSVVLAFLSLWLSDWLVRRWRQKEDA